MPHKKKYNKTKEAKQGVCEAIELGYEKFYGIQYCPNDGEHNLEPAKEGNPKEKPKKKSCSK